VSQHVVAFLDEWAYVTKDPKRKEWLRRAAAVSADGEMLAVAIPNSQEGD
jgi:hypothetical protein